VCVCVCVCVCDEERESVSFLNMRGKREDDERGGRKLRHLRDGFFLRQNKAHTYLSQKMV
jgi:hypothetical protein